MIDIKDKAKCCGCGACVQRCPKQCIAMHEDNEGFPYPKADEALCIDCGLCEKVCPILKPGTPKPPLAVYAAKNNDEVQRLDSSSGGLFVLLAELTIRRGGIVFGASFDGQWMVRHTHAETLDELTPLMRSKYVQSDTVNTFKEAECALKAGRQVLYVGSSCQIAGLRRFLRKDYDNLLAVDIVCHGAPSPGVWRTYLDNLAENYRQNIAGKTVTTSKLSSAPEVAHVNFRAKQSDGFGWKQFGVVVHASSSEIGDRPVLTSSTFRQDIFMRAFIDNLILRPSCHACVAKQGASGADLTLGDFWGIEKTHPEFDDDKGVSVAFVNTDKGAEAWEQIVPRLSTLMVTFDEATAHNTAYLRPVAIPRKRKLFWKLFRKTRSLEKSYLKAIHITTTDKIRDRLYPYKDFLVKTIKRLAGRSGSQA